LRIIDVRERSFPISRYSDTSLPSGGLNTSAVALITDVMRDGEPVIGYGFASIGRFAQSGLIRERFAPRLLQAREKELIDAAGENIDPFRAWKVMMAGEKPGGHGERCVAVGTLDMAVWDATAKIAGVPLFRLLADRVGNRDVPASVRVYAGGGYYYPNKDVERLTEEIRELSGLGYTHVKIKIGATSLGEDLSRIDSALKPLKGPDHLAVDAMNSYSEDSSLAAAKALAPLDLWWFEDICDPLDFETWAKVASAYPGPIASGEALFSAAEAKLMHRYGGLRPGRDVLQFDPVHCYGLPGFLEILDLLMRAGWTREAFWPHGGHLFCLHVVTALNLGGAEANPLCFQPFGGFADRELASEGRATPPQSPGIGFELKPELYAIFKSLLA
jgi:D(-)-tartrate dehydratase